MIRLGGGQGFYGDGHDPVADLLAAGVDYLVCEALAELTLAILQKDRQRDEALGYTRDLPAYVGAALPYVLDGRTKFITNAGGINPIAAGRAVADTVKALGGDGPHRRDRRRRRRARPLPTRSASPTTRCSPTCTSAPADRRRARGGRRHRRHRSGRRRVAVPRAARPRVRLGVGRLGPARRRRRGRPPARVLRPGDGRQLLGRVVGEPRPAAHRLPDRRVEADGDRGDHEARRHRRHGHASTPCASSCSTRCTTRLAT